MAATHAAASTTRRGENRTFMRTSREAQEAYHAGCPARPTNHESDLRYPVENAKERREGSAAEGGEIGEHRVGRLRADDRDQILAGGAAHAGKAAEGHEERLALARADAGDLIEL